MIYIIFSIIIGAVLGFVLPLPSNQAMSLYFIVGIFAILDSIVGAIKAILEKKFDSNIFLSGFITNTIVAIILAYIGDTLGLPLYYAAIFVFGTRLFANLSIARRVLIRKYSRKHSLKYKTKMKNRRMIYSISLKKRQKY